MKDYLNEVLWVLGIVIVLIGLSYAFGWIGVHQTQTIHKAQKNAERQVFEQTQSYVEAKRQEALKFYREYQKADLDTKQGIREMIVISFANFDESKLSNTLENFIYACKYE